jgi:hypothetical protein
MENTIPIQINFYNQSTPDTRGGQLLTPTPLPIPIQITIPDTIMQYCMADGYTKTCKMENGQHIQIITHTKIVLPTASLSTLTRSRSYRRQIQCSCVNPVPITEIRRYTDPIQFATSNTIEANRFAPNMPTSTTMPRLTVPTHPWTQYRERTQ